MSSADWEEVKRLAADFQRAQLSTTVQRLSDRNCIEIVSKLIGLNLLDVIYTIDGKEYLTPQELKKEIHEELLVRGGRINLVELQQIINVDFSHIETKAHEIVKTEGVNLILGQLIDRSYLRSLAEEINDYLQEQGHITVAELTKKYDLPSDYLRSSVIDKFIGSVIHGKIDSFDHDIIFTQSFISRNKAKVRGAFSSLTRPTSVSNILHKIGGQEKILHHVVEELISELPGSLTGSRRDSVYIPNIYIQTQTQWVLSCFKQNGYLEYDNMVRLGITDAKSYIKKWLKEESLYYLGSCCVGQVLLDTVDAMVDESLRTVSWVDISQFLPSSFNTKDSSQLLQMLTKSKKDISIYCDTIVVKHSLISDQRSMLESLMPGRAEHDVRQNPNLLSPDGEKKRSGLEESGRENKKDQRRQKASGSSKGGGTQGRETKTKSVKKKGGKGGRGGGDDDDENDDFSSSSSSRSRGNVEVEFLTVEQIEEQLMKSLSECPSEFITEIAQQLYRPLKRQYQESIKSVYLQTTQTATSSGRKKTHSELQDKINGLWTNIKLFEKGIKYFNRELQIQLSKHLLKTISTDITNLIFGAVATDKMMSLGDDAEMTTEARVRLLSKLPDDVKVSLTKLHTSLNKESLDEFHVALDLICDPSCLGIMLKKPDKKKERQLIFSHRQVLLDQLKLEQDSAMLLHLVAVVLFQTFSGCMVHAPGRCVPHILTFLADHMLQEQHQLLTEYQDLVIKQLKQKSENNDGKLVEIENKLEELKPQVKELAIIVKKSVNNNSNNGLQDDS
ncbi:E3 UFM1-protein ligase 1-like isoform X2 [Tubulanus polymorphus]|uniref:E3 UFM1-protein ligase 1-like isoform X2 n=1 Tax=Tubulanus polymorphus TaxID=672921 RepID=UPI003DA46258